MRRAHCLNLPMNNPPTPTAPGAKRGASFLHRLRLRISQRVILLLSQVLLALGTGLAFAALL